MVQIFADRLGAAKKKELQIVNGQRNSGVMHKVGLSVIILY